MARSDLLVNLVRAGTTGDRVLFRRSVEALVAEERLKNHNVLADRLTEYLQPSAAYQPAPPAANGNGSPETYLYQVAPELPLTDLVLPARVLEVVGEVLQEQSRRDLLRSHGLEPRHRLLLVGPPGNGKTSLAESIAYELMVPLFVVRYESIIGSFLGETGQRLQRAIDFARSHHCVLFFDEFDAIAKERGDTHETGEIKRVVSSLLMQIDDLPSHVVVVTASNHPELLDRAVWRRFQVRLELPPPTVRQIETWIRGLESRLEHNLDDVPRLVQQFKGSSYSDMKDFSENVLRAVVLEGPDADVPRVVRRCADQHMSQYRLKPGRKRAPSAKA